MRLWRNLSNNINITMIRDESIGCRGAFDRHIIIIEFGDRSIVVMAGVEATSESTGDFN